MAKLRKWCAYRTLERPYTRFSKYRKKGFVKSRFSVKTQQMSENQYAESTTFETLD